ncbi:serine proteinase stubble [Trichonephila clavata]|uniref:Serine proteinase stubble n=1 Tax=Trichonephila clavata TaxID=2740835 RepID=A0A8X6G4Z4_TRICU|nr:serine proteinase stubble [Trichonephila clavata]
MYKGGVSLVASRNKPTIGQKQHCSQVGDTDHSGTLATQKEDGGRVIQPYSCRDPATKEEGVCMFSWNCQRSNGTHLTYCMDRFYFGSCCRLPPGVYIATPPSVSSNEVTETQKVKQHPSTQETTADSLFERWSTNSTTEDMKSTRVPAISMRTSTTKPTLVPATEFPPGLYTWRPNGQTKSTLAPIKAKPTKLFSTKPVFASSTIKFNATEKPHHPSISDSTDVVRLTTPNTKYSTTEASTIKSTAEPQSTSATSVSRRRTRPTRPYGSTYPKRKTRPTRPYLSKNSTHSKVTQRKTKPTRPMHLSTASVSETEKVVLTTRPTLGTWSNILDRTTRPFSWRKTTPATVSTRRTTPAIATKRTTPTISSTRSTASLIPTKVTLAALTRTTVSPSPSIVSSTTSRPTVRTTIGRKRTRPTRPHAVTSPALAPKTTQATKATKRPSTTTKATQKPNIEEIIEIITFPPFPGVTHKSTKHPATTTPEIRRTTTLRPKPTFTTPAVTGMSTTQSGTTTTEPQTQKIVPGQDYTKDSTVAHASTSEVTLLVTHHDEELDSSSTLNPDLELTTDQSEGTTEQWFTTTSDIKNNTFARNPIVPHRPVQVLYDEQGNEIVNQEHFEEAAAQSTSKTKSTATNGIFTTTASPFSTTKETFPAESDITFVEYKSESISEPIIANVFETSTPFSSSTSTYPDSKTEILTVKPTTTLENASFPSEVVLTGKNRTETYPVLFTKYYSKTTTTATPTVVVTTTTIATTESAKFQPSTVPEDALNHVENADSTTHFTASTPKDLVTTTEMPGFQTSSIAPSGEVVDSSISYDKIYFEDKTGSPTDEGIHHSTLIGEIKVPTLTTSSSNNNAETTEATIHGDHWLDDLYDYYDYYLDPFYDTFSQNGRNSTNTGPEFPYETVNNHKITSSPIGTADALIQEKTEGTNLVEVHSNTENSSETTTLISRPSAGSHKNRPKPFFPTIPNEIKIHSKVTPSSNQKKPILPIIPQERPPVQAIKRPSKPTPEIQPITESFKDSTTENFFEEHLELTTYPSITVNNYDSVKTTIVTIDNHRPPVQISAIANQTLLPHPIYKPVTNLVKGEGEKDFTADSTWDSSKFQTSATVFTTESTNETKTATVNVVDKETIDNFINDDIKTTNTNPINVPTISYPFPTIQDITRKHVGEYTTQTIFSSKEETTVTKEPSLVTKLEVTSQVSTPVEVVTDGSALFTETTFGESATNLVQKTDLTPTIGEQTTGSSMSETEPTTEDTISSSTTSIYDIETTTRKETTSSESKPGDTVTTTPPSTTTELMYETTELDLASADFHEVCGRPTPGPMGRIVGGGNSYFGEWPWVVSLRQWKKNAFLHKCGATLLNEFWAITAAHCVEK